MVNLYAVRVREGSRTKRYMAYGARLYTAVSRALQVAEPGDDFELTAFRVTREPTDPRCRDAARKAQRERTAIEVER
jgi:hypothetical protein